MRQQLVLSLGILVAVLSPIAIAQNSNYPSLGQSNQPADCSDPLLANSAQCQGTLSGAGVSPQYQGTTPQTVAPSPLPQPTMSRPQTYTDMNNPNLQQNQYASSLNQKPLPPQPLTQFQQFVAGSTGQVLPIFGANLFQNAPSTFAPVNETPVPPDYVIGPGDVLRIRIWGQVNFNADVRVDRAGEIYLPQVGQVHVAGLPYSVLRDHLRAAVGRVFRNFDLTADIGQIRALQIYVTGLAHRPGTYTVSSLSTLVDAIFASGGPSVEGSMRHIYLKRGGNVVADFDLYDLLVNGDKSKDAQLQSGDVIYIPPAGPQVALTGSVRRPAIYELRSGDTVAQLLKDAGGPSTTASDSRISIERIHAHQDRAAMEVNFDAQGLATPLDQGDIVRVISILPMYQNTVTLRGYVANPGRFAWHKGMRVSDIIPDRDSLLSRNYWWRRAQLGLPAPEFEPVPFLAAQSQPSNPVDLRTRAKYFPLTSEPCRANSASENANEPRCTPGVQGQTQNQSTASGTYNQTSQFGQAPAAQFEEQPADGMAYSQMQQPASATQQPSNRTIATRERELSTQNTAGESQRTRVTLTAPEIDWDYAVIERMDKSTLKTSLIPFDLGKLVMDHDPSQNLELQPGDIVTVFSQEDIHVPVSQQTKFVTLEGEFVHAGTYSVKPGETLPELVARAGGFTPNAYLYGSEFTRESTRILQQARIDEYVQNLEMEIARGNLAQSTSAVATAQDLASASSAQIAEHELISRLQQLRATGRIVLEEKPNSAGIQALPPIQLENGDRFIVPSRPASINVVGSVYDQNSFLYLPDRRVGDYLHLAGGPNRDADKKHAFVIRADGSVVSRAAANGIWGNTFYSMRVHPGDSIVVPEKTYGPTFLRGFLDWSQVVSQLGLGAAAINVLR